jgi:hypothetical protein
MSDFEILPHQTSHRYEPRHAPAREPSALPPIDSVRPPEPTEPWTPDVPAPLAMPSPLPGLFISAGIEEPTPMVGARGAVSSAGEQAADKYNAHHSQQIDRFEALTHGASVGAADVMVWQAAHHLNPDGKIGRDTLAAAAHDHAHGAAKHGAGDPRERGQGAAPGDALDHGGPAHDTTSGLAGETGAAGAPPVVPQLGHDALASADAEAPKEKEPGEVNHAGDSSKIDVVDPHPAAEKQAAQPKKGASGLDSIEDYATTKRVEQLHAEEIFADVPANFDSKKHAFDGLNAAVHARQRAQAKLDAAKAPEAREAAQKQVAEAQQKVETTTEQLKDFLVDQELRKDPQGKQLLKKLKVAKAHHDDGQVQEINAALDQIRSQLRAQVDAMKHGDAGHENESVFAPEETEVTTHDFVFADGEHVKVSDHVVSYATTAPLGVDSDSEETKADKSASHAAVEAQMTNADLGSSRTKILKAVSGFEGGFDSVNSYDKKQVTWGFVQWAGGSHSDLTQALAVIKKSYPDAFERNFQAYGIDVVKDQLVITSPDGTGQLVGDEAAAAIAKNPRLAAALSHAGRDEDVQKGEVKAADQIEIEAALAMPVPVGKTKIPVGQIITSEYGVGVLANTYVHSGSGAALRIAREALENVTASHPYKPDNDEWAAQAENAIIAALASADADRAAHLAKALNQSRGSFKP